MVGYDQTTLGEQIITLKIEEKTVSFIITVLPGQITKIKQKRQTTIFVVCLLIVFKVSNLVEGKAHPQVSFANETWGKSQKKKLQYKNTLSD